MVIKEVMNITETIQSTVYLPHHLDPLIYLVRVLLWN